MLHLFRSTFWNTGSGHIPHFFAPCRKTKTPDFAWKSGVYCYLLFFKVVPPVLLKLNFNQADFIELITNMLYIKRS